MYIRTVSGASQADRTGRLKRVIARVVACGVARGVARGVVKATQRRERAHPFGGDFWPLRVRV